MVPLKECDDNEQHSKGDLSPAELESIALRVAEILKTKGIRYIGRIALRAFLFSCWAGLIALLAWLGITNKIPPR